MNHQAALDLYEKVIQITDKMVIASKSKDWDSLEQLESKCAQHIETIRNIQPKTPISKAELKTKTNYIHKILKNDREIRNEMEPSMAKLASMMNSAGTQQKLVKAYGNSAKH